MMPTVTDSKSKCNDELSNDDIPLEGNKIKSSIDCNLSAPTSLLGRTLSASAIDYRSAWRTKKKTHLDGARKFQENAIFSSSVGSVDKQSLKRKLSNTSVGTSGDVPEISIESENTRFLPLSTAVNQEGFVTPFQLKKISRPNSPATIANSRASILTRGRVASIRRESDCSTENEAAHEKMIKSSQQVSLGFEDFCLDDKLFEERKRAKSLTEPISVFTNAFLPQSSSPSPTRTGVDTMQKQCYSPSTQQVVRANISYSPIPSPTMPASPYNRMRSMSPIAVRQVSKRRYTASSGNGIGNQSSGSGLDSDNENSSITLSNPKRRCTALLRSVIGSSASPLVRESTSNINLLHYQQQQLERLTNNFDRDSKPVSVTPLSFSSNSSVLPNLGIKKPNSTESSPTMSRLLVDPQLSIECFQSIESRENDDSSPVLCSSFCSGTGYDANSSTFSSRADTPHSEMLENSGAENEASTSLLLPSQSSCSFDCSSLNTIPAIDTKIPPPPTSSSNLFLCNERKSINE